MQELNTANAQAQALQEQIKQMKQMQQAMQQQMQQAMNLNIQPSNEYKKTMNLNALNLPALTGATDSPGVTNSIHSPQLPNTSTSTLSNTINSPNPTATLTGNPSANSPHTTSPPNTNNTSFDSSTPLVSQLLNLGNNPIFQSSSHTLSPKIPTPSGLSSYTFPNPMLPSATTPKHSNPFDSQLVANGFSLTMQQIVAAQNAQNAQNGGASSNAVTSPKAPTSPLNALNIMNNQPRLTTASLDLTGSLPGLACGGLAGLRSCSADSAVSLRSTSIPNVNNTSKNNGNTANSIFNSPATPLSHVPSLPALQPTASVGSLLSFRGLSDPLANLVSGLPRMDSGGLFLPTVGQRDTSIPQVPTTPNITQLPNRNLSDLNLISQVGQGNSHFVPYNATGFFEPPTPSNNDANGIQTQANAVNTPSLQFAQWMQQNPQGKTNKKSPQNNRIITAKNNEKEEDKGEEEAKLVSMSPKEDKTVSKEIAKAQPRGAASTELTLMAEGKITVASSSTVDKNPNNLRLPLNDGDNPVSPDEIDEQVIITPNLMNLNSLTG
eukprot:102609_1